MNGKDFTLEGVLSITTGIEVLELIDELYENRMAEWEELSRLFEVTDESGVGPSFSEMGGRLTPGTQKEVEELPVSKIRKIKVFERWEEDEYYINSVAEADLETKRETVTVAMRENGEAPEGYSVENSTTTERIWKN